jgi:hypothetical protein
MQRRGNRALAVPVATFPRYGDQSTRQGVVLIVLLALALRVVVALLTSNTYDYDEFVVLLLARDMAHGAIPYRDFMFFHPPGILVIFRALEPLTAAWWPLGRSISVVLDAATTGLVFTIGQAIYGRRAAYAAGILYAFSPVALISSARIGQDPIITFLGVASVTILLASARSRRAAALAGALVGSAVWVKYPAAYFLPVALVAAGRRWPWVLGGSAAAAALLLLPFTGESHALYQQTIDFQRTRWSMAAPQRLETVALYWLAVSPFAVIAAVRLRGPLWLWLAFVLGGAFALSSQVYYHYYVPVAAFAALLGAPLAANLFPLSRRAVVAVATSVAVVWALIIDVGGPAPLYVTAAHLSSVTPTVNLLQRDTRRSSAVLGDRDEYAYLAGRPSVAHYFWNVGVLVNARYLERRLSRAGAVVLSQGASSGYPAGFEQYLDARYPRVSTDATSVWILRRSRLSADGE